MLNVEIETLFSGFSVGGVAIPVNFLFYEGHGEPYIVYMESDKSNSYSTDDEIAGCVIYYDFDIYSKGNYLAIATAVRELLSGAGWTWEPSRESRDLFDVETGYYHKTICFAKPVQI